MSSPETFATRIKDILRSVAPLPAEARSPILHYHKATVDAQRTLDYFESLLGEHERPPEQVARHFGLLRGMALVHFIEAFERFLKEVAAECVDRLAALVVDNRFDRFPVQGSSLASHFGSGSAGRALCESSTWLNCPEINDRFRKLLAEPFKPGEFYLFPMDRQTPLEEGWRHDLMALVWQVRNTSVHNVGVITRSDAVRLSVMAKMRVDAPRMLVPSKDDLFWLKRFLDDTAAAANRRIGERLAQLLGSLHADLGGPFVAREMADSLARIFRLPLQVADAMGTVPEE